MADELELERELYGRAKKHPDEFPSHSAPHYVGKYKALRSTFQQNYQQYIDAALALKEGILFTSHGKDHFKTVIVQASRLIDKDSVRLTGYEIYVLLVAIHLHDIGNLFGRYRHEKECWRIINQLGTLLSDDGFEQRLFYDVAMAHGGIINKDKDTIRSLRSQAPFRGQPVHLRKLAAILRLADELADDYSRVSQALIDFGIADSVYHLYARGLQSVEIRPSQSRVELYFSFPKSALIKTWKKDKGQKVWLIDELLARCLKTFLEMRYTSQYMRTINVDELYVQIEWAQGEFHSPLESLSFTFESLGFPAASQKDIYSLVPALKKYAQIGKVTGKNLSAHISRKGKATPRRGAPKRTSAKNPKRGLT